MKKLIVIVALLATAAFSAQAQVRVEVAGNLGWYTMDNFDLSARIAPRVSAYYLIPTGIAAGVEVGLSYAMYNVGNETLGAKMSISNIQLPFRGTFEWEIGEKFSITPMLGFYFGCAVGGKTTSVDGTTHDPFAGNSGMQRFDFGTDDELVFTFGKKLDLSLGIQKSFLNLCKDKTVRMKAHSFYFGVGYRF